MNTNYNDIKKDIVNSFAKQYDINPLIKNSFVGKIINTFSYGIYQVYLKFDYLFSQTFANTANLTNLKLQAQNRIKELVPKPSKGNIIIGGNDGAGVPSGTEFNLLNSNLKFKTITSGSISTKILDYSEWIDISIINTLVTMTFNDTHSFINNMIINISNSNHSELNGNWIVSVISDKQISFKIDTPNSTLIISSNSTIPINISYANLITNVVCIENGNNDLAPYTELENSNYNTCFVDYNGLYGGRSEESENHYRQRYLDFLRYPQSYFNSYFVKNYVLDNYPIVTRCTIDDNLPITNQVSIYLINDNRTDKMISSADIDIILNDLNEIRPINININNLSLINPTQSNINIDITGIYPNLDNFRDVVKYEIESYINSLDVGKDVSIDLLKGFIYSIRDYKNDNRVQAFTLVQTTNISVAQGVLSIPIVTVN